MSLIALIPTFHVVMRIMKRKTGITGFLLVFFQALIISVAILTRRTSYYGLVAIFLAALAMLAVRIFAKTARRTSPIPGTEALLMPIFATLVICLATLLSLKQIHTSTLDSAYSTGVKGTNWWYHRLYISLGVHPQWPFEQINCKYLRMNERVVSTRSEERRVRKAWDR